MRLLRRLLNVPSGRIIQITTMTGKVLAEFHDDTLYRAFIEGLKGQPLVTIEDVPTWQQLVARDAEC